GPYQYRLRLSVRGRAPGIHPYEENPNGQKAKTQLSPAHRCCSSSDSLFEFHKPLIEFAHFPFFGVTGVEQQAVTQRQVLPFRKLDQVGCAFHVREAGLGSPKRIGGHQAVTSNVPTSRMVRQDGYADRLAVNLARIITPSR